MKITSVRIHLIKNREQHDFPGTNVSRLLAFATITVDDTLVIYDFRILRGDYGLFVGMPCRKVRDKCPNCLNKNMVQAKFCNYCGRELAPNRFVLNRHQEQIRHMDMVHPLNEEFRLEISGIVLKAYQERLKEDQCEVPL